MNRKKAVYNVITNLFVQIVVAISGFVLPKLIIVKYGSAMNGMISSIGQFLTYAALVELGVGNAAIINLYQPLAYAKISELNDILAQARKKYFISGCLYSGIACAIALVYPLFVSRQTEYSFVFLIAFILALNGTIDYFFIGKYKVLLIADQKTYILNSIKGIATCLLTIGSVVLLMNQYSLILVKGLAVITHLGEAYFIRKYVRFRYPQITFQSNNHVSFAQQNSAMIHQLCMTIVYNTDLVIMTLFLSPDISLQEISVYTVYLMAKSMITNLISALTNGMNASFGVLFAKQQENEIRKAFQKYELLYFCVLFICYSCFTSLIFSFVACYTKGITDVQYVRFGVGILFGIVGITAQLKDASGVILNAAGHYRQSRKYAIMEAVINIVLSMALIRPFGIIGVLFGTVVAHCVMDIGIMNYVDKNLIIGSGKSTFGRVIRNLFIVIPLCSLEIRYFGIVSNWAGWFMTAITILLVNCTVIGGANGLFEIKIIQELIKEKRGGRTN